MYLYQQQQQVYGGEGQLRVSVQWGKADFLQLPENTNASSAARLHNHLFRNYSMAAVEDMYKFPPMNSLRQQCSVMLTQICRSLAVFS